MKKSIINWLKHPVTGAFSPLIIVAALFMGYTALHAALVHNISGAFGWGLAVMWMLVSQNYLHHWDDCLDRWGHSLDLNAHARMQIKWMENIVGELRSRLEKHEEVDIDAVYEKTMTEELKRCQKK